MTTNEDLVRDEMNCFGLAVEHVGAMLDAKDREIERLKRELSEAGKIITNLSRELGVINGPCF